MSIVLVDVVALVAITFGHFECASTTTKNMCQRRARHNRCVFSAKVLQTIPKCEVELELGCVGLVDSR